MKQTQSEVYLKFAYFMTLGSKYIRTQDLEIMKEMRDIALEISSYEEWPTLGNKIIQDGLGEQVAVLDFLSHRHN